MTENSATEFWHLDSPGSTAFRAAWDEDMDFISGRRCPTNPQHLPLLGRNKDLSIVLPNRPVPDFVWTWYSEMLVQDHVLEMFREQRFTGFVVKPVQARFKGTTSVSSNQKPPRLWEIVVTGWGGVASDDAGITVLEECPDCCYIQYAKAKRPEFVLSRERWDGSDFFRVWPYLYIVVTNQVVKLILGNKLKGVAIRNPVESLGSNDVSDTLTPACLSYYMPTEHARRIGEACGIPY